MPNITNGTLRIYKKSGGSGSGNANIFETTQTLVADTALSITVPTATKLTIIDVWSAAGENLKGNIDITKTGNVATLKAYDNYANVQVNIAYS